MPEKASKCHYCGEPLAARPTGTRGRPAITHPGDCRRLHNNRVNLEYRIRRFRAAHERIADRSIVSDVIATEYDPEEVLDFSPIDPDPYRGLYGAALMHEIEQWEKRVRIQREIDRVETVLALAAARDYDDTLPAMPQDERAEIVRRAVARRLARSN